MMKYLAAVAAAVLIGAACGGGGGGGSTRSQDEQDLRAWREAWVSSVNDRDFEAGYNLLSSRCRSTKTLFRYQSEVESLLRVLPDGDLLLKGMDIEKLEGNEAITNSDIVVVFAGEETRPEGIKWRGQYVKEDGRWLAEC